MRPHAEAAAAAVATAEWPGAVVVVAVSQLERFAPLGPELLANKHPR
jgi:hypothetical protein